MEATLAPEAVKGLAGALREELKVEPTEDALPIARFLQDTEPKDGQDILSVQEDGTFKWMTRQDILMEQMEAEMKAAITAPIERTLNPLVAGIPIGSIVLGGLTGGVITEAIDGFAPEKNDDGSVNFVNVAAKGAIAFMLPQVGGQLLTRQAMLFAVATIAFDVARNVVPLEEWIQNAVGFFTGSQVGVLGQADRVVQEYSRHKQPPEVRGGSPDRLEGVF